MPRRARVRQGDRQAAKRADKTKSPPGRAALRRQRRKSSRLKHQKRGGAEKNFSAPPLFNILTACRKYCTRNCILFEFAVRSAAFLLQIIVFSEKICYT